MIETRELSKRYGRTRVLNSVDLTVGRSERVAVLGLNGAGKTTLIRCLMGVTSFQGLVTIDGRNALTEGRVARSRFGYVPQRAPHFDGSLLETLSFFCSLRGISLADVARSLDSLGLSLTDHGGKQVRELSGGMLQKSLLALALGAGVPLLLLDEPTANLDTTGRREFLRALGRIEDDVTILLATHQLADVESVADRLLVLHGGGIVFDGSIAGLRERVGATATLWLNVPPELRDSARSRIERRWQSATILSNGAELGIRIGRELHADVLLDLHGANVAVSGMRTEVPSLQDLLERLLAPGGEKPVEPGSGRGNADS